MLGEDFKETTQDTEKKLDQQTDLFKEGYFEQDSLEIRDNVKPGASASPPTHQLETLLEPVVQEHLIDIAAEDKENTDPSQEGAKSEKSVEVREKEQEPEVEKLVQERSSPVHEKSSKQSPIEQSIERDNQESLEDSPKFTAITTKNHDGYQTFQTATGNSILFDSEKPSDQSYRLYAMDDYPHPNDLLMGGGLRSNYAGPHDGADLADYELPPYSGSSSGASEPGTQVVKQPSPAERGSSTSSSTKTSLGQAPSSSQSQTPALGLVALQKLLVSGYSNVSDLVHWKKPIETGIIFAIGGTLIIALTFLSIISVVAYSALGIILASGLIRAYKAVMGMLNKSPDTPIDYIWNRVLNISVGVSSERLHELVDSSSANLNASLAYFKQVLLVEDKFATFKVAFFLYMLTYVGAMFNGMTLITLSYLALFTLPKVYEKNHAQIDEYVGIATRQVSSATSLISSKFTSVIGGGSSSSAPSAGSSKKQN